MFVNLLYTGSRIIIYINESDSAIINNDVMNNYCIAGNFCKVEILAKLHDPSII